MSKFQQDDAHIFCTESQIQSEIHGCIEFLKEIYGIFGFEFTYELATRPVIKYFKINLVGKIYRRYRHME